MGNPTGWRAFHFGPPVQQPVPIVSDGRLDLVALFGAALRRENSGTFSLVLSVRSANDLGMDLLVVEHVTAVARWYRPQIISIHGHPTGMLVQGDQLAMTMFLPKIDRNIEHFLMAKLREEIIPGGLQTPNVDDHIELVAEEIHPAVSTVYSTAQARFDQSLLLAINSLGTAFFALLGLEGRELSAEDLKR